jgi:hypothetical protein
LDAISRHAKGLGYDAVVLFLDELVLWLASRMGDVAFVSREGSKVVRLVEADAANRPAPIVSFIACQRDLRELVGDSLPGARSLTAVDVLQHSEGRFDTITLGPAGGGPAHPPRGPLGRHQYGRRAAHRPDAHPFSLARRFWSGRLLPMLLRDHGLDDDAVANLPPAHPFVTDARLVKSLLIAALVPEVAPLRALTVSRLTALNSGVVRAFVPGTGRQQVLERLRRWAAEVGELKFGDDEQDPTVTVALSGVDTAPILEAARGWLTTAMPLKITFWGRRRGNTEPLDPNSICEVWGAPTD